MAKQIVLATIGSLGDLHPCLAIGLELKRRGHLVTIVSTEAYRARVERLGIGFHALRPNWDPTDATIIAQCEDLKTGPEVLFRKLVLPHLEETYEDLLAATAGADLLIAGDLVFAAPLVAEKRNLKWASAILSPTSFFSAYDPSLLVNVPSLYALRKAGWRMNRAALSLGSALTQHWWEPIRRLRRKEGLRPTRSPLMQDKFSPYLVLALFSKVFATPQPDWPAQTVQTGFVFYDEAAGFEKRAFEQFCISGKAPVVFTLGSTAVHNPGEFFEVSA